MRTHRLLACALAAAIVTLLAPAPHAAQAANTFLPTGNGWVSWDVPAIENSPAWCCFDDWRQRDSSNARCELDGKSQSVGGRDGERTDTVRIYAKQSGGKVERVRVLAPTCEARASSPIEHLGARNAAESSAFLGSVLKATLNTMPVAEDKAEGKTRTPERELYRNTLAALAAHRDGSALDILAEEARGNRPRELRRDAVFWIGQNRGEPGVAVLKPILLQDADANIREHAAFSLSQTKSPQAAALLIRQAESDPATKVRSQAWFWLAQMRAPETERAINTALQKETERKVRRQAVFALSQLPAERAIKALVAVAENQALDRDDRKQAVFWIGQNDSPDAAAYMEKTLLGRVK